MIRYHKLKYVSMKDETVQGKYICINSLCLKNTLDSEDDDESYPKTSKRRKTGRSETTTVEVRKQFGEGDKKQESTQQYE